MFAGDWYRRASGRLGLRLLPAVLPRLPRVSTPIETSGGVDKASNLSDSQEANDSGAESTENSN